MNNVAFVVSALFVVCAAVIENVVTVDLHHMLTMCAGTVEEHVVHRAHSSTLL